MHIVGHRTGFIMYLMKYVNRMNEKICKQRVIVGNSPAPWSLGWTASRARDRAREKETPDSPFDSLALLLAVPRKT